MQTGSFYHIYNRGNNKQHIFFEEKNYRHFLNLFDKYLSSFVDVYAYCLMPNHFHFLVKVKEFPQTSEVFKTSDVLQQRGSKKLTPLEKGFKDFFISYSKGINKAYDRTGSLFQAKFKKKEIVDNSYFTSIIQYIHVNPVKAKLCSQYEDYKFSSYNAIITNGPTHVKREEVLEWFGNKNIFVKVHEEKKVDMERVKQYLF
jgi:REP element-mobilizing transposase RayT